MISAIVSRFQRSEPTGFEAYSQTDIELEAESVKTEMKVKESELDSLDNKFIEKAKEAAEATGPKKDRLMRELAAIKQDFGQQQAEYDVMLKEYTTYKTIANAKSRMNSRRDSMLHEMDKAELQSMGKEVKREILGKNKHISQMEKVADTIDQTLTAITGDSSDVDEDVREVVEAFEQGQDLSEFSLAESVDLSERETEASVSAESSASFSLRDGQ